MTIANANSVSEYATAVIQIRGMLENLSEWSDTLPAPDDDCVPNLHYGHLGTLLVIRRLLREVSSCADQFHD